MKVMFISDIHGSFPWLQKAMDIYQRDHFDKLIILGDFLYHGPRNPLPDGYDCQKVAQLLNSYKDEIIAVRGNCDAEVDQMVLEFDIMQMDRELDIEGHRFFLTHGHHYHEDALPAIEKGTVLVYGHYHKPLCKQKEGIYIINPSSISLPKEGVNSYGIYQNDTFTIKDFSDHTVLEMQLNKC